MVKYKEEFLLFISSYSQSAAQQPKDMFKLEINPFNLNRFQQVKKIVINDKIHGTNQGWTEINEVLHESKTVKATKTI